MCTELLQFNRGQRNLKNRSSVRKQNTDFILGARRFREIYKIDKLDMKLAYTIL